MFKERLATCVFRILLVARYLQHATGTRNSIYMDPVKNIDLSDLVVRICLHSRCRSTIRGLPCGDVLSC